jgi:hypothetical protein
MTSIPKLRYLALLLLFSLQGTPAAPQIRSLADLSRDEAKRREALEQQGIEGKVIESDSDTLAPTGNITVFTPGEKSRPKPAKQSPSEKTAASPRSYRTALQKLDRTIVQEQERLDNLSARLQAEKWAIPKSGRLSSRDTSASQSRMQDQILELQSKLKRLRQERLDIYEAGKKAGFLPGELDGKGIIP